MTHLTLSTTFLFLIRASDLEARNFFLPRKLLARISHQERNEAIGGIKHRGTLAAVPPVGGWRPLFQWAEQVIGPFGYELNGSIRDHRRSNTRLVT